MNKRQSALEKSMSLHVIKDKTQLTFTGQHADFIADNLETLIENTYRVAPVRKAGHPYVLVHKGPHRLTPSAAPREKHWERAIFEKWKNNDEALDPRAPFRRVVSYQVMLRDTNDDAGWGEVDLFGATKENLPVVVELKTERREDLLRAIVEVLAYGVAIRKAWSGIDGCPLRSQWAKTVGEAGNLVDLPLAVVAPDFYWQAVLNDSQKKTPDQTPMASRQSIKTLMDKMHRANYPLTFVEVTKKPQLAKSGLPDVTSAVVRELTIPTGF